jgi:recombination protein U
MISTAGVVDRHPGERSSMRKPGKQFEDNFKNSIPEDAYYKKFNDASIGFDIENSTQRFAPKSPYDYILFRNGRMYSLELKSVQNGAISYAGVSPMIKEHQINELIKAARYGIISGFVVNFRDTGNTYFLPIANFEFIRLESSKKSFNENDIKGLSIEIPHRKLKVNYRYDLSVLVGGD